MGTKIINKELNIPYHIGIIMDGNGRWAKKRLLPRVAGHRAGSDNVIRIVRTSSDIGVKVLTLYAFSTENWKRPVDEVSAIMKLIIEVITREFEEFNRNGVKIRILGDRSMLADSVRKVLEDAEKNTAGNNGLLLNLAINYGARAEIVSAVKSIASDVCSGVVCVDDIDERLVSRYLGTCGLPDPDLIIRTSGEIRLSNFLLYQSAYSELYFTDVYWPDFDTDELLKAIYSFNDRKRRFGNV